MKKDPKNRNLNEKTKEKDNEIPKKEIKKNI